MKRRSDHILVVLRLFYPTIVQVAIPFFTFAGINFFAFQRLCGWWGLLAPLFFMFGGIVEGIIAETAFDQRVHGFAVVLLNAGLIAEYLLVLRHTTGLSF